jgi:hypothetical protein
MNGGYAAGVRICWGARMRCEDATSEKDASQWRTNEQTIKRRERGIRRREGKRGEGKRNKDNDKYKDKLGQETREQGSGRAK